jgi:hypothetical protein
MMVTSQLSIDIVRYIDQRAHGAAREWVALSEIADHVCGPQSIEFDQAVDLARCKGWIIVEGKSASRRACLTSERCLASLAAVDPDSTASRQGMPH